MIRRRKSKESSETGTLAPPKALLNLTRLVGGLGLYAGLLLIGLAVVAHGMAQQAAWQVQQTQAQQVAQIVANQLAAQWRNYALSLEQLRHNPMLVQAFQRQDFAALKTLETQVRDTLPGALSVRLLTPGFSQLDEKSQPPFGFAALELLRQAEKQPAPAIEVHLPTQGAEHVALARSILAPGGSEVIGVIYAALNTQQLDGVKSLPAGVALRLEQRTKEKPVVLRSVASGQFSAAAIPIPGTLWQVQTTVAHGHEVQGPPLLWAALGIALLLLGIGSALPLRWLRESFRKDQATLVQQIRLTLGGSAAPVSLRWQETLGLLESLQAVAREAAAGGLVRKPTKSGKAETPISVAGNAESGLLDSADLAARLLGASQTAAAAGSGGGVSVPPAVFLHHEIGGNLNILTPQVVRQLGQAIGSEAQARAAERVVVACDYREHGPALVKALCEGLQASGVRVVDLGRTPAPVWQFAVHFLTQAVGVWIGASQRAAPDYNGLRFSVDGQASQPELVQAIASRVRNNELLSGAGRCETQNLLPEYIGQLSSDVPLARMLKVVVEGGGGLVGQAAAMLLRTLGCDVVEINCELSPAAIKANPTVPETLIPLARRVREEQADLGLAYDADGDRLGVVDSAGEIVWADTLLMLFAGDILARQPGVDIIYDVECSRHLAPDIVQRGGRPVQTATGWMALQTRLAEGGALLAGGISGHIFFKERWYGFADALYASARLLELISMDMRSSHEVFAEVPHSLATPQFRIPVPDASNRIAELQMSASMILPAGTKLTTLDGVRADFEHGWGIVRTSHAAPEWILRFEADDPTALAQVQQSFRDLLNLQLPDTPLPF